MTKLYFKFALAWINLIGQLAWVSVIVWFAYGLWSGHLHVAVKYE